MKKMMTAICLVAVSYARSQTYYTEYLGQVKTTEPPVSAEASPSGVAGSGTTSKITHVAFTLYTFSNDEYLYYELKKTGTGGSTADFTDRSALLDKKNGIFYDFYAKTKSKLVTPRLSHETGMSTYFLNGNDTAYVYFEKGIPETVTGKMTLSDHHYGVRKVVMAEGEYELQSWAKTNFDFSIQLEKAKAECTKKGRSICPVFGLW